MKSQLMMQLHMGETRNQETKILPVRNFDTILREHGKKVYNTVYCMLGNEQDAEDLAQEIFLNIYVALPRFKGRSSINTWIYRITMNEINDFLNRKKRTSALHADMSTEALEAIGRLWNHCDDVETVFQRQQLGRSMQAALGTLAPAFRAVFVLKEIEGYAYREIGDILNIPIGTVESRLFRARDMLRKQLSGAYESR